MKLHEIQPIWCDHCGVLAVARMEATPLCTRCLLSRLHTESATEIEHRVTPLKEGRTFWAKSTANPQSMQL